ncbi:MAG: Uma2 family endonuclease [Coriobacteriales bacterium]|jgi:Uma2 family endonuclease|nr:Uma2 family endonuclease [Coriobacteriales bacterium]
MAQPQQQEHYTYADYLTWGSENRYELIGGEVRAMSPAPSIIHQEIVLALANQLFESLRDDPCRLLISPVDVRLNADAADDTVIQPDLVVVCDEDKIGADCVVGAPTLVVEVLSPSSARYDRLVKFNLYRDSGVPEYWIVDPESRTLQVNIWFNGGYLASIHDESETVESTSIPGCLVDLGSVFPSAK